ncbi:hypothetical protein [Sphaerisporangium sp. TRM90804]|uniref:hypothetical protein n=1 Tax=Sphaerisporangium sp. TRM90804 TaxID=3031113 RepID=UPI00244D25A3|nr:hypothetical protein [Sphaerisporangium sp. TRM90804]MDH2430417.1 hypothetical protein [Sphaerisporangium sp. TRM90804]
MNDEATAAAAPEPMGAGRGGWQQGASGGQLAAVHSSGSEASKSGELVVREENKTTTGKRKKK